MRGDSVEVTFSGEIKGATRDDVFRVVREVAESFKRHQVAPAGESAVMVRHAQLTRWWEFLLLGWWAFVLGDRDDTLVVNTRPTQDGTYVDIVGTGVSHVADEIGDALDALNAGGTR